MNLTVAQLTLKEEDVKVCHSAFARLCSFMSNRLVECWEGGGGGQEESDTFFRSTKMMFQALPEDYKNPILIKMIEKKTSQKRRFSELFGKF